MDRYKSFHDAADARDKRDRERKACSNGINRDMLAMLQEVLRRGYMWDHDSDIYIESATESCNSHSGRAEPWASSHSCCSWSLWSTQPTAISACKAE